MDILLPTDDGTTQGTWQVVGGSTREEVLLGDTSKYAWIDDAAIGDYFDQQFDNPNGAISDGAEMRLKFCGRNTGGRTCTLKVRVFDGEPGVPGTQLLEITTIQLTSEWVTTEVADTWNNVKAITTDFTDLWIRVEVMSVTGVPGSEPDVECCLLELHVPTITKNLTNQAATEASKQVHIVHTTDGRHRKITYDGEWSNRDGTPFESPSRAVISYETA